MFQGLKSIFDIPFSYRLHSSKCLKYGIFKHFVSYVSLTHKHSYSLILLYSTHSKYYLCPSKQS